MKKKILILEDDDVNQELLKLYLKDEFDIVVMATLTEALKSIDSESFDLFISDLFLGEDKNGGIEFLKKVKSDPKLKQVPVVAFTGFENPNDTNELKFTKYIQKPVTKSEFLAIIKNVLDNV